MGKGGGGRGWGYGKQGGGYEDGGGRGGNRWSRGGGGGGGKGSRTPWSFIHVCDDRDSLGLWDLSQQIPNEWVDGRHGGRRKPERMHSTVLLNMNAPSHLPRLQMLAQQTPPLDVLVRELFCERVERIADAEVYAIGVGLSSPGLRALKDAWNAEEPEDQRRVHVPYDGDGHISLVYIRGEFQREAQQFVEERKAIMEGGRTLLVDHISYADEWGKESSIVLAGVGAAGGEARASKGARRDGGKGAVSGGTPASKRVVEIDGSVLEGGGQILRMSSAYSALFNVPIHIINIRAGRKNPGLAAQHLESLRLVRDVSRGSLTNDYVGSVEVSLSPGGLAAGQFSADPGTAGSVTLMVQASLFPLLFAGGDCSCNLRGGTDVAFSPPLDFMRRVLLPSVRRMGARVNVQVLTRGFFPKGGGHVRVDIPRLTRPLQAIDMADRGEPQRVEVIFYATKSLGAEESRAATALHHAAQGLAPEVHIEFTLAPAPDQQTGKYWVDIVVETTTGSLFHGGSEPKDLPGYGKGAKKGGKAGSIPDLFSAAAREACEPIEQQLATGSAIDCHLIDQLVLPASLAQGTSRFLAAELSLHAQTAIHIAELMVPGAVFRSERQGPLHLIEVEGIGHNADIFAAGTASQQSPPTMAAPSAAAVQQPARGAWGTQAAAPQSSEGNVQFRPGTLSAAAPEMLRDFETDMGHLSGAVGVQVIVDTQRDRLVIRGGSSERTAAKAELQKVLSFYNLFPESW